ncbi:MAG: Hsp70 family protein [Gemmataceae bacterium]
MTFDIDANGILNVSAKDKKTGKEVNQRIENSSGLSKEEVDKMRRDADSHADEDKRKKEMADARNEADATIWQVESMMREAGDKIGEGDKAPVNAAIEKLREAMKGDNVDAVRTALNTLQTAAHAMAQHVQRAGGGASAPPSGDGHAAAGGPKGDDVIDAEYEVKK